MRIRRIVIYAFAASAALLFSNTHAEEPIFSGFMSDYTQLSKVTDGSADYRYLAPGAEDTLSEYNAVMIDQPEIFIADDSPYRGSKPKHLDALAEAIRGGIVDAMSEDMYVVDRPGHNVLYLSVAATNVKLTKKKKGVLGYVPVALVVGGIQSAATTDLAKKADLSGMVFELEAFDSVSGERLVAIIDSIGDTESPATWEELEDLASKYGRIVQCRFDNARLPVEQRVNCLAQNQD